MDTIWDSKIRGCGALIGELTGLAFAQTGQAGQGAATPTGGDDSISASTASERHQDFLDWPAGNLDGTDTTALDGTIRTTLKQIVDERRVAGEISANAADAFKQQLDVTDVPLLHVATSFARLLVGLQAAHDAEEGLLVGAGIVAGDEAQQEFVRALVKPLTEAVGDGALVAADDERIDQGVRDRVLLPEREARGGEHPLVEGGGGVVAQHAAGGRPHRLAIRAWGDEGVGDERRCRPPGRQSPALQGRFAHRGGILDRAEPGDGAVSHLARQLEGVFAQR